MNPVLAMFYVFLVYSVGDFIADKTKAFISMFLVSATVFTISFWNGVPRSLFVDSGQTLIKMFLDLGEFKMNGQ